MGRPGANLLVWGGRRAPRDMVLSPVIANPVNLVTGLQTSSTYGQPRLGVCGDSSRVLL